MLNSGIGLEKKIVHSKAGYTLFPPLYNLLSCICGSSGFPSMHIFSFRVTCKHQGPSVQICVSMEVISHSNYNNPLPHIWSVPNTT